jgi:hypothetical protein
MLLGSSLLLSAIVGDPPSIHAALAGFLIWILGVLLGGPLFPEPGAAAGLAVEMEKLKHFFFGRQYPKPAPA